MYFSFTRDRVCLCGSIFRPSEEEKKPFVGENMGEKNSRAKNRGAISEISFIKKNHKLMTSSDRVGTFQNSSKNHNTRVGHHKTSFLPSSDKH